MSKIIKSKNINLSEIDLKTEGIKAYINQRNHFEVLIITASKKTPLPLKNDKEHLIIVLDRSIEITKNENKTIHNKKDKILIPKNTIYTADVSKDFKGLLFIRG